MSLTFQYQGEPVFHCHDDRRHLTCAYCQRSYDVAHMNPKLKEIILPRAPVTEWATLLLRCIRCDLNDPAYPFKYIHPQAFVPNQEQGTIIAELYQQLLLSTRDHLFLVEGYAGTGKTSMITYLLKYPEFATHRVCFAAPTNKALQVMMDKLGHGCDERDQHDLMEDNGAEPQRTWIFKTVFKLLDSKVSINSQGDTVFTTNTNEQAGLKGGYGIIIVDEVSMVNRQQLTHFLDQVNNHLRLGADGCPIIVFLGDVGQLPPINESSAIIFDPHVQSKYRVQRMALTQIMRSQGRLTELSLQIRSLIPIDLETTRRAQDLPGVNLPQAQCSQITYFDQEAHGSTVTPKHSNKYSPIKRRQTPRQSSWPTPTPFVRR